MTGQNLLIVMEMIFLGSRGASSQALKLQAASVPTLAQGFKLQAKILKR